MNCARTTAYCVLMLLGFAAIQAEAVADFPAPPGGWDYTFNGDAEAFGTGGFTSLDGTWAHDEADRWDGSASGEVSDPAVDADGSSPGGVGVFTEGDVTYLRLQDTGEPRDHGWNEDGDIGVFSNRRLYFGHDIASDPGNGGATGVLDSGITLSFRARIATTDPLDDQYLEGAAMSMPWPAEGKGYDLGDDARGMFGVEQNGSQTLGFVLAQSSETPDGIGGGLVMNNKSAPIDTESATPENVNLVPFTDTELTAWHEFYITIEGTGADTLQVNVWSDGSLDANEFIATAANSAEYDGETLMMGLASGSRYGAYDVDFVSYKLGVHPVPEPSTLSMAMLAFGGALLVIRRRLAR